MFFIVFSTVACRSRPSIMTTSHILWQEHHKLCSPEADGVQCLGKHVSFSIELLYDVDIVTLETLLPGMVLDFC